MATKDVYYYKIRVAYRNQLGTSQVMESKFMSTYPEISDVIEYIKTRLTHGDKIGGLKVIRYVVKEEQEENDGSEA